MEKINVIRFVGVLLVGLFILNPCVSYSTFTAWEGPGCDFAGIVYMGCDCFSMDYHGAFDFIFEGQPVHLFDDDNWVGNPHTTLSVNTTDCNHGFGWKSLIIPC
ncbi:antimicrobial peptide 1-like [Cryptomeria japonica]|uniref:antimicrobial peptide 1-like n=1 Tax=Cryptomeria japonica TaxID=3369 RepID=UPI0025AD5C0D|nr:antimicrobial peptide 1-like [Cryptomeria japonica]